MNSLLLRFWLMGLVLLTGSRLALMVWQWPRVLPGGGVLPIMIGGLRIDLCLLSMITVVPAILSPWLGHRLWPTRLTSIWLRLWWLVMVFLEVATPQFIVEFDLRPNRLFIEYLGNPVEVSAMLWNGYKLLVCITAISVLLAAWCGWRWLPLHSVQRVRSLRWRPVISVVSLLLLFAAARGTLAHRPLNPSMVAYSNDALLNALSLNSTYGVAYAAYQLSGEKVVAYGHMPDAQLQQLIRAAAGITGPMLDTRYPTLHQQSATTPRAQPLNLVIIVQESLGAQYVGTLASPYLVGTGLTPELDKLLQQGWAFSRLYATGTRSARGLEAITAGFMPTTMLPALKLSKAQQGFFTLAELLGRSGYDSRFIYGGEAHFDNMRGFFLGNGFKQIHDLPKFVQPAFVGSWGAADEDMFNELHQLLLNDGDRAVFTVAFTVSNHTPWEYPAGRITAQGEPASLENTVRYADWAMGQFFQRARQAAYWQHTLFLIVADHDAKVFGADAFPVEHFHIPALIVGADVKPRWDTRLVSQIDLAPTLLSLIGLDTVHPMTGMDLTVHSPDRAMMQYDNRFGLLAGNQLLVLQPAKSPTQFTVTGAEIQATMMNKSLAEVALAYTLWPVWAYQHERYRLPE